MTNKRAYIIYPTTKNNIKTNCICREKLINQERFNNMDDERYMISKYDSTENLTKFYKTKYSNFFITNKQIKFIEDL
jgi:hypothetical protein